MTLLEEQNRSRDADLVPVRHGRMMVSPFTFYRGAARIMAEDLWPTPTAGLTVQLCGDAHLSNFGLFASPERVLVFDINDFDETLPGPFEYDVKRLAASITVAARHNGFSKADTRQATRASVTAYREAMAEFARMSTLDVWYAHLSAKTAIKAMRAAQSPAGASSKERKALKQREKVAKTVVKKARQRDSIQALSKLAEQVDGRYRIVSQPPFIVPLRDIAKIYPTLPRDIEPLIKQQLTSYGRTLQPERRHLLERFEELVDAARKVVGVGSVGTRAFIALFVGKDEQDPLFLQLKEATTSVLESHLPRSRYRHPGRRVVHGQRLMQGTSDIFLGWTTGVDVTRKLLLETAARHEGLRRCRVDGSRRAGGVRQCVRVDPGQGARALGRPGRDRRVPRGRRRLRPRDDGLRQALRRPERTGLRGIHGGRADRTDRRRPRTVTN